VVVVADWLDTVVVVGAELVVDGAVVLVAVAPVVVGPAVVGPEEHAASKIPPAATSTPPDIATGEVDPRRSTDAPAYAGDRRITSRSLRV
jgi:hypothetical protein